MASPILLVCTLLCVLPEAAFGQAPVKEVSRREPFDAGLVLETGVRTGACDVLSFTPDGNHLLAAGDDKVVRVWPWNQQTGLDVNNARALRWPIFREHRGNIYAMAIRPPLVAVGGSGAPDGTVAVIDLNDNQTMHGLTRQQLEPGNVTHTIWSIAFSPSGNKLAYGTDRGSIWLWDLASGKKNDVKFIGRHEARPNKPLNKVKFLNFRDENSLLSVAQDGLVLQWSLDTATKQELFRCFEETQGMTDVHAVALSPDGHWLAVSGEGARKIELHSMTNRGTTKVIQWNDPRHYAGCLAFDAAGKRLAVGLVAITQNHQFSGEKFSEVTGGKVYVYDLAEAEPAPVPGPTTSYYPEALAFHPSANQLAIAGGDDYEVALWDLKPLKKLSETPIIGRSVWGVGLSSDGKLCFRDRRAPDPIHPNRRSLETASWRVFDLKERKFDSAAIQPLPPIDTMDGWSVIPDKDNRYLWYAENVQRKLKFKIPLQPRDGMPRCYTFFKHDKDKDVRLAVGHYWGVSIYELTAQGAHRTRLFNGHQGETMAMGTSAEGKMLVSSSRDQTVIGWSLADWPSQPELGARFLVRQGKLMVDSVDAGSPAWEAGLQEGDEVLIFRFNAFDFLYDPHDSLAADRKQFKKVGSAQECIEQLRQPVPGLEFYFRVLHPGAKEPVEMLTTVRQRPLWRFFPTTDGEWVLWRWRDFYYDTSDEGDSFIGWQLSRGADETPRFFKAKQFRARYHKPEKLAEGFKDFDGLAFAALEPPLTRLDEIDRKVKDADLALSGSVTPAGDRSNQQIARVLLWINDYKHLEVTGPFPADQPFPVKITVPRAKLRGGPNVITLQAYNQAGGRGETTVEITYDRPAAVPRLFGLFVGVNNYEKAIPPQPSIRGGTDARGLAEAWGKLKGRPYASVQIRQLIDRQVSVDAVLGHLKSLREQVGPDDLLVFYLGGHGINSDAYVNLEAQYKGKFQLKEQLLPGEFWFCGPSFELERPSKDGLRAKELYHALAQLPCRKLVLLDACHSGDVADNPVRILDADGVSPIVFVACKQKQKAFEDALASELFVGGRAYGLFAVSWIMALEDDFEKADRNGNSELDVTELKDYMGAKVPRLFKKFIEPKLEEENNKARALGQILQDTQTPKVLVPVLERRLRLPLVQKREND